MSAADIIVTGAYFALLLSVTVFFARRSTSASDFLSAHHDLPWWALCLSLVATETSTLTFISVPGLGYTDGLVFVGLAGGYLIGRTMVAVWFLPLYARGRLTSVYQQLGHRFGRPVQEIASGAFLLTRLIAESVRLATGMIPIAWLLAASGLAVNPLILLLVILVATVAYTLAGGLRAVIWSDTIQLAIYTTGAAICVFLFSGSLSGSGLMMAEAAGKFDLFHHGATVPFANPFTPAAALIGGTILSLASHGTDQLLVQRVLAARTLTAARMALIGSAVLVGGLFLLLSLTGVELWIRAGGVPLAAMGLRSPDELFPHTIVTDLPPGLRGLLVAGVLSATMGSLSATLNAMATASLTDFGAVSGRIRKMFRTVTGQGGSDLAVARSVTVFWAAALCGTTLLFAGGSQSAVLLSLSVAGWSYGPLLGVFLFSMLCPAARTRDAVTGLLFSLLVMGAVLLGAPAMGVRIAFPWLVPAGAVLMLVPACSLMWWRGRSPA